MSSLETRKIEPQSSTTVTLGEAGDTVAVPTGAIVKTNTVKDAGGNTLFTSDGAGTFSSVNSAISGSMIFISSQTASSSASISFTTGIDSTYDEYVFFFVNINSADSDKDFMFNGSDDSGSTYAVLKTTTYFRTELYENNSGGSLTYITPYDLAQSESYQTLARDVANSSDTCCAGELHLFAPSSTGTYVKQFYSITNNNGEAGTLSSEVFVGGYFNTDNVINAITFKMESGNINDGTIYLYGIS